MVVIAGILSFIVIAYQVEVLHDVGKPIFNQINTHGLEGLKIGQVAIIFLALISTAVSVVILQFLKSLFDKSIKKHSDTVAEEFLNDFNKWVKK